MRKTIRLGLLVLLGLIVLCSVNARAQGTWTDRDTGLVWTQSDNGSDINWYQAKSYCANMTLGGYSDWRMATIEELESLSIEAQDSEGHHVKPGIKLSPIGSIWSRSPGETEGEAALYEFNIETRSSLEYDKSREMRTLCVRGS